MRLSRAQLIQAYREAPDSPLRQHIEALEEEIRLLEGVSEARRVMAASWEDLANRLRETQPDRPGPASVVVVQNDEPSHPLRMAAPLLLTEEEIIQYAVEIETFDS